MFLMVYEVVADNDRFFIIMNVDSNLILYQTNKCYNYLPLSNKL